MFQRCGSAQWSAALESDEVLVRSRAWVSDPDVLVLNGSDREFLADREHVCGMMTGSAIGQANPITRPIRHRDFQYQIVLGT